jgi:hypothetical protein
MGSLSREGIRFIRFRYFSKTNKSGRGDQRSPKFGIDSWLFAIFRVFRVFS